MKCLNDNNMMLMMVSAVREKNRNRRPWGWRAWKYLGVREVATGRQQRNMLANTSSKQILGRGNGPGPRPADWCAWPVQGTEGTAEQVPSQVNTGAEATEQRGSTLCEGFRSPKSGGKLWRVGSRACVTWLTLEDPGGESGGPGAGYCLELTRRRREPGGSDQGGGVANAEPVLKVGPNH